VEGEEALRRKTDEGMALRQGQHVDERIGAGHETEGPGMGLAVAFAAEELGANDGFGQQGLDRLDDGGAVGGQEYRSVPSKLAERLPDRSHATLDRPVVVGPERAMAVVDHGAVRVADMHSDYRSSG